MLTGYKSPLTIQMRSITEWAFAITALFWTQPYFVWESYSTVTYYVKYVMILLSVALTLLYLVKHGREIDRPRKTWSFMIAMLAVFIALTNLDYSFLAILDKIMLCVCGAFFLLLNEKYQLGAFVKLKKIFIVCLIPGLIVYTLLSIGISFPHGILAPLNPLKSSAYELYFGMVRHSDSIRFTALFDEPGVLGTFSALFLAGDGFRIKKNFGNVILLIAGILSGSLAFFMLLMGGLVIRSFCGRLYKKMMAIILLSIAILLFFNVEISIPWLSEMQTRLLSENWDNRTSQSYILQMTDFWSGSTNSVLLGLGMAAKETNPLMHGGASWLDLVYDYGVIGFALILCCIVFPVLKIYFKQGKSEVMLFLVLFVVSIYQRSQILNPAHFVILFGGCGYIMARGKKTGPAPINKERTRTNCPC